jgi:hypothetical protein
LPLIVLIGGIIGGLAGYLLLYWTSAIEYPINVAGRPLPQLAAFIPITFECAILGAALAAVFGMLALNKLPMPYHPVFNAPRFPSWHHALTSSCALNRRIKVRCQKRQGSL